MSGNTSTDGDVYVGRSDVGEVGKVNTNHGQVHNFWCHGTGDSQHGDVLILHPGATFEWRPFKSGQPAPDGRVSAGTTKTDGKYGVFVARDSHGACGKLNLTDDGKLCNLWVHGHALAYHEGEILVVTSAAYTHAPACAAGTPWGAPYPACDGGYLPPAAWAMPVAMAMPLAAPGWNPNILCDGLIAGERAAYFEQHEGLSADVARHRVMREFPAEFGSSS